MSFARAVKITIDHTQVPADIPAFGYTVVVAGVFPFLKNVANGGYVNDPNGYDIEFFGDAAQTDYLNYQLIPGTYDGTTGAVEFWVQLDVPISSLVDTSFYMFFDDPTVDFDDSGGAWNNSFQAVWPFANGSVLDTTDYSNFGNNLTVTGTVNAVPGQIFGGAGFPSSADGLLEGGDILQDTYANPISMAFWISSNGPTNGQILSKTDNSTSGFLVSLQSTSLLFTFVTSAGNRVWTKNSAIPSDGSEYRVIITYSGNTSDDESGLILYIDGVLLAWDSYVDNSGTFVSDAGNDFQVGGSTYFPGATGRLNGELDTVMYLSETVPPEFVAADFANQKTSSTFYSMSDVLLAPIIDFFLAEPSNFIQADTTILVWESENGVSADISSIGTVALTGQISQSVPVSITFTLTVTSVDGLQAIATIRCEVGVAGDFFPIVSEGDNVSNLEQSNALGPFYENGYVYFIQDTSDEIPYTAEIWATKSKYCQEPDDWDDTVGMATRPSYTYGAPYSMQFLGLACGEYIAPGIHDVYVAFTNTGNPALPFPQPGILYFWKLDLLLEVWAFLGSFDVTATPGWSGVMGVDATNGDCYLLFIDWLTSGATGISAIVYSRTSGFGAPIQVDFDASGNTAFTPEQIAVNAGLAYYFYNALTFSPSGQAYLVKGPTTTGVLPNPGGTTYLSLAISRPFLSGGNFYFTMPSTNTSAATLVLFSLTPAVAPTIFNSVDTGLPLAVDIAGVGIQLYGANSQFFKLLNGQLAIMWRNGPYDSGGTGLEPIPDWTLAPINGSTFSMGTPITFTLNTLSNGTGSRAGEVWHLMPYFVPFTSRLDIVVKGGSQLATSDISLGGFVSSTASYICSKGNIVLG